MKAKDILLRGDIIGLYVKVVGSKNKCLVGIEGFVVDETQKTIAIESGEKVKKIMKKDAVFEVKAEGKVYHVNSELLLGRPEDRIKKIRKIQNG